MSTTEQVGFLTYPPYVLSDADRERWDLARAIAEKQVELYENAPDPRYVWMMTRWIYASDVPTGAQADQDAAVKAAAEHQRSLGLGAAKVTPVVAEAEDLEADPVEELFARLQAEYPADDATAEEWDAHTGKVADLLDLMFGDPDQYDFGEYEHMHPDELGEAIAFAGHGKPYSALLHPRDRMGKWSQKLNGVHQFVAKNRAGVRMTLAAHLSAAAVKLGAMRSALPGGAYHHGQHEVADIGAAHKAIRKGVAGPEHFKALASEERKRHGVSGARRQAEKARTVSLGTSLTALAYIYSEKAEREFGPAVRDPATDPVAAMDAVDRAKVTAEASHKLAEYAIEHRRELGGAMRAAGHLAYHVARAKGLAAADDRPDDEWVGDDALVLLSEGTDADAALAQLGY